MNVEKYYYCGVRVRVWIYLPICLPSFLPSFLPSLPLSILALFHSYLRLAFFISIFECLHFSPQHDSKRSDRERERERGRRIRTHHHAAKQCGRRPQPLNERANGRKNDERAFDRIPRAWSSSSKLHLQDRRDRGRAGGLEGRHHHLPLKPLIGPRSLPFTNFSPWLYQRDSDDTALNGGGGGRGQHRRGDDGTSERRECDGGGGGGGRHHWPCSAQCSLLLNDFCRRLRPRAAPLAQRKGPFASSSCPSSFFFSPPIGAKRASDPFIISHFDSSSFRSGIARAIRSSLPSVCLTQGLTVFLSLR